MNAKIKNTFDVIDTGYIDLDLPFKNGTETISFNPNDTEFYYKFKQMFSKIEEKYKSIEESGDKLEIVHEFNEFVKAEFDNIFNGDVSSKIFKYCSPSAIVKNYGIPYVFHFLQWIDPIISKELEETAKKVNKELEKARKKYGNG